MPKTAPSAGRIVVIAGFALSCFGLLLFLWLAFGGSVPLNAKGYRFEIAFRDAATLANQADVRVAGVNVGKVVKLERDPRGNRMLATVELQSKYAPLRSDAQTILRQKTLLGETYVELTFGTPRARHLPEGARLPDRNVSDAVTFDELLRTFDEKTRRVFQQWQATSAAASRGRAQDINDALGNLPRFATSAETLVQVLNRRRDALKAVVRDTGTTFDALNRDSAALQRLIRRSDDTLSTLADRRQALAETFQIFPTFLDESRLTLSRLERFSRATDPLIRDLEPVLEDAQPTLRSLGELGPDAQRLFEDLPALIRAGDEGLPALSRVLRGLDPTLASLGPFLQNLNPILEFLELYQATASNFISIGASAIGLKLTPPPGQKSTNGHALPQLVVTGSQSFPAENRTQDNRGTAYGSPAYLLFAGKAAEFLIPPSFDCDHVGGERRQGGSGSRFPACHVDTPVPFEGRAQRYPQVRRAAPGGLTQRPQQPAR